MTVLKDCLCYLSSRSDISVTALVHKKELCDYPGIRYMEFPEVAGNWLRRLRFEYVTLKMLSLILPEADLWLSLHDTTPRVKAHRQAVYCQTSFPFMKPVARDWQMDLKIPLFCYFTRFVYRFRAARNQYMIVQQEWLRKEISKISRLPENRLVVAPPVFDAPHIVNREAELPIFLYPATPDCHKNVETLCRAAALLEAKGYSFKVVLTMSGTENKYASFLKKSFSHLRSIDFRGYMDREELYRQYGLATCLVFPSRVETWGLPISEYLPSGKPMLLADLPYSHETAAGAACVAFFPERDEQALTAKMEALLKGDRSGFGPVPTTTYAQPYAADWAELFELLLNESPATR